MNNEKRADRLIAASKYQTEDQMRATALSLLQEAYKAGYAEAFKQHANFKEDMGK